MEYLNSIPTNGQLVPDNKEINYNFRKILHYGLTEIEPYLWLAEQAKGPLSNYYHWPNSVYEESIRRAAKSSKAVASYISDSGYILENGFSLADIYYYHILTWAKQHNVQHEPATEHYLARLEQRKYFPQEMNWKHNEI